MSSKTPIFLDESLTSLRNEYAAVYLIYHRNKNQHRALSWWKYLNMIHRSLRKIILSHDQKEYKKLRDNINELQKRKILDKAYREFNGIVALGQFVTLGMTLIAVVSRIWNLLEPERQVKQLVTQKQPSSSLQDTGDDLGEIVDDDLGQVVAPPTINSTSNLPDETPSIPSKHSLDDIFGPSKKKKKKLDPNTKKIKKSKKKKSDIDDIFL